MADCAHVTSIEAIASFRAALLVFIHKAHQTLEAAYSEVTRTRLWLQTDRRFYWEYQCRRRAKAVEQARQACFTSRLGSRHEPSPYERQTLQRAEQQLEEATRKLRLVGKWNQDFDQQAALLVKQLDHLHTLLVRDLPKAAAHLMELVKRLDVYAGRPSIPTAAISELQRGEPSTGDRVIPDDRSPGIPDVDATKDHP